MVCQYSFVVVIILIVVLGAFAAAGVVALSSAYVGRRYYLKNNARINE